MCLLFIAQGGPTFSGRSAQRSQGGPVSSASPALVRSLSVGWATRFRFIRDGSGHCCGASNESSVNIGNTRGRDTTGAASTDKLGSGAVRCLKLVLDERAQTRPDAKKYRPEQFFDDSVVKELEKEGFFKKIFAR